MKTFFSEPELNISRFTVEDVITTSGDPISYDPDELPIAPQG